MTTDDHDHDHDRLVLVEERLNNVLSLVTMTRTDIASIRDDYATRIRDLEDTRARLAGVVAAASAFSGVAAAIITHLINH